MPTLGHQMYSPEADISDFNNLAWRLERAEVHRSGKHLREARQDIAVRLGITKSTLENYRVFRLKTVPRWLYNKLKDELIAVLQSEMSRLEHEIQIARQTTSRHSDDALIAAETQLAKARELLET